MSNLRCRKVYRPAAAIRIRDEQCSQASPTRLVMRKREKTQGITILTIIGNLAEHPELS
jgi:hypothetical protein